MTDRRISSIDPAVVQDSNDLFEVLRSFGPYVGRFISETPVSWLAEVEELIETNPRISDLELKRARDTLIRLRREGFIFPALTTDFESDWEAATKQLINQGEKFEYVVGQTSPDWCDFGVSWTDAKYFLSDPINSRSSWEIKGSLFEYQVAFEPLIRTAKTCCIVDPYFNPLFRHSELLESVMRQVSKTSSCKRLIIISECKKNLFDFDGQQLDLSSPSTAERIADEFKRRYSSLKLGQLKVIWFLLWSDRRASSLINSPDYLKMHDRYFLTDKGGLELSKGFDVRRVTDRSENFLNIRYLEQPSYDDKYKRYVSRIADRTLSASRLGARPLEIFNI